MVAGIRAACKLSRGNDKAWVFSGLLYRCLAFNFIALLQCCFLKTQAAAKRPDLISPSYSLAAIPQTGRHRAKARPLNAQ